MAYRLLLQEQRRNEVREQLLESITKFMWFSLALTIVGFASEISRNFLSESKEKRPPNEVNSEQYIDGNLFTNYDLDFELKFLPLSIMGDATNFVNAPNLTTIYKSQYQSVCATGYSEHYKVGVSILVTLEILDEADNLIVTDSFAVIPSHSTYMVRFCQSYFVKQEVGNYRVKFGVAGNILEKKYILAP